MKDERIFLSIDFEDLAHDLKRDLGLWETGPLRVDALWKCYETIDRLMKSQMSHATFFCTGIIAEQAPDLIERIAKDGHEVACHYHFHDELRKETPQAVERNLRRAKDVLEEASGLPVIGFRAPKFRIEKRSPEQYQAVERHFAYDSSYYANRPEKVSAFRDKMGLTRLIILPIFGDSPVPAGPSFRLGGSFVKLFPSSASGAMIGRCLTAGMIPHIYVHPYEFAEEGEFELSDAERETLSKMKSRYWGLRQKQWNRVGNKSLHGKLASVCDAYGLRGRLRDNLGLFSEPAVAQ